MTNHSSPVTAELLTAEIRKIRRELGGFDYATSEAHLAERLLAGILAPAQSTLMTEHTPLPWRESDFGGTIYADNVPKGGPMRVADVRGWGYLTGALGLPHEVAAAIQQANADLIVRCVNSHDELITALRRIRSLDEKNVPNYAQQIAREALADIGERHE